MVLTAVDSTVLTIFIALKGVERMKRCKEVNRSLLKLMGLFFKFLVPVYFFLGDEILTRAITRLLIG